MVYPGKCAVLGMRKPEFECPTCRNDNLPVCLEKEQNGGPPGVYTGGLGPLSFFFAPPVFAAPLWGGLSTQGGYGPGGYPTWTGRLLGGYWAVTGRLLGGYITGVVGHLGLF